MYQASVRKYLWRYVFSSYNSVCLSINKIIVFLGDTVVYKPRMATVIIEANDDPNGIFLLESTGKAVEEGKTNDFL